MSQRILLLPGDGIGPEVMEQAQRVLIQKLMGIEEKKGFATALAGVSAD